jgi:uncharacterized protein
MQVEIIYAGSNDVYREQLEVPAATTVAHVIERSGLMRCHPELDWGVNKLGIFGRLVAADMPVQDRDRIEIYRPLKARKRRR